MRYQMVDLLGTGGMGQVYRARDQQLDRMVALKILRGDDPDLLDRLMREARAQAKVAHPCVCDVYEVGEQEGKPFIAMQLVKGEPLDVAAEGMSLEEKVDLLLGVAEAVQAAHSLGLIHRDLKPGNVMVERREGRLHPYVLDFGLALEQDAPGLTATGKVLGTPAYMAPEQVKGAGALLDRRCDVYSLGAILYEILAGRPPFTGPTPVEVMLQVLEKEPQPLRRLVPGFPTDLDLIVSKCLEKDPERRYGSARLLAEDLERYRSGEPVLARRPSLAYRLQRKLERHKQVALVAGIAVVLIVLLGLGGGIKYTLDLRRERSEAIAARVEAEEVLRFLVEIFEVADPREALGETITAREILERGTEKIQNELEDNPQVRATLLGVIGTVSGNLGLFDDALPLLQESLRLRRQALGNEHPAVVESVLALARLRESERHFPAAEWLYIEAIELLSEDETANRSRLANAHFGLAKSLEGQERSEEAEARIREAMVLLQEDPRGDDRLMLPMLATQATILRRLERFDEAEELQREALARQRTLYPPEDPALSTTLNNLAYLLQSRGAFAEAETLYREALEIHKKVLGEAHPQTIMLMSNLASALDQQGKHEETESLLRDRVTLQRSALPANHWRIGASLTALGRFHGMNGRYSHAEPVLREALEIYLRTLGEDHLWVAFGQARLAVSLYGLGRDEEARALTERSFECFARVESPSPDDLGQLAHLIKDFRRVGEEAEAERFRSVMAEHAR